MYRGQECARRCRGRNLPSALPPKAEIHILKVSILAKLTKPRQCLKDFNQSIPYLIILNSRVYFITVLGLLTHHSMYRPITAVFFIPSGVEICICSSYNLELSGILLTVASNDPRKFKGRWKSQIVPIHSYIFPLIFSTTFISINSSI